MRRTVSRCGRAVGGVTQYLRPCSDEFFRRWLGLRCGRTQSRETTECTDEMRVLPRKRVSHEVTNSLKTRQPGRGEGPGDRFPFIVIAPSRVLDQIGEKLRERCLCRWREHRTTGGRGRESGLADVQIEIIKHLIASHRLSRPYTLANDAPSLQESFGSG